MAAPRLAFFPDDWAKYPALKNDDGSEAEGPRSIKMICDVTDTAQKVSLIDFVAKQVLSNLQSVKIDNSESSYPVTIQSQLTGDRITIPGECMAFLPWQFTLNDNAFTIVFDTGAPAAVVTVWLYNTPKPAAVWYTQGAGQVVTISGTVTVEAAKSTTATRSSVAGAIADTSLLVANAARRGASVFNDSTATLYIGLGATAASTTNYTAQVAPGGLYELPANFAGEVRGIWSAATGNARITEF